MRIICLRRVEAHISGLSEVNVSVLSEGQWKGGCYIRAVIWKRDSKLLIT